MCNWYAICYPNPVYPKLLKAENWDWVWLHCLTALKIGKCLLLKLILWFYFTFERQLKVIKFWRLGAFSEFYIFNIYTTLDHLKMVDFLKTSSYLYWPYQIGDVLCPNRFVCRKQAFHWIYLISIFCIARYHSLLFWLAPVTGVVEASFDERASGPSPFSLWLFVKCLDARTAMSPAFSPPAFESTFANEGKYSLNVAIGSTRLMPTF